MKWKMVFILMMTHQKVPLKYQTKNMKKLLVGQAEGLTIEEKNGMPVLTDYRPTTEEIELSALRSRRAAECFSVIDRSVLWHNRLTEEQRTELAAWYQAWLDVTETKIVPAEPAWLKEV